MNDKDMKDIYDDVDEIGDETDRILEDTDAIDKKTQSIDRKIWLLVLLWIIDKIIIYIMINI